MKEKIPFSIENISVTWLALGSFVSCVAILLGVIAIARPYLKDPITPSSSTTENNRIFIGIPTAQAMMILSPNSPQNYSSSSGLYPPDPSLSYKK